jgi:hypothetical protein
MFPSVTLALPPTLPFFFLLTKIHVQSISGISQAEK